MVLIDLLIILYYFTLFFIYKCIYGINLNIWNNMEEFEHA